MENMDANDELTEPQKIWADICPYTWRIKDDDPMILEVLDSKTDSVLMRIYVGAILEASGRTAILEHCMELENSPWVDSWHETDPKSVWKILKK
jgi:hypothetical protein